MESHKAIRLFHPGRDLGQKVVWSQTHRAGEGGANLRGDDVLHPLPDLKRVRPFGWHQRADHLVDGADCLDGENRLDGFKDLPVKRHISLVPRRHKDDAGTLPAGIAHKGAALYSQYLRLAADGNEPCML
jgi:hypothetical protein